MEILLTYIAKSAGLLIVFFALYYFLLRKDHSFSTNRKFLLGGLFASAILPSVQFTRKVFIEAQTSQFQMIAGDFPVSEVIIQEPVLTPMQILLAIYLTGVAFMTGRMLLQLISLFKVLYSGQSTRTRRINYIKVTGKMAPFSFLNFIVYNPALHSETELLHILKHEKAHVLQWHTADVLLANLNLIYQWFNPFAWLYVKILQQNLEYIADSEAVKEVPCRKEYQKALVKISIANFNPVLTNSFYQSFIKKRIVMLNRNTTTKNNYWKISLALPLMLAFIFLFNVKTEAQIKPTNENKEESISKNLKVSGTITKNSTEESLATLKKVFAKQKVTLGFENIQRSSEGIITKITVRFLNKKTNSSGVTNQNNPEGINSFEVFVEDGTIGFANVSDKKENGKTAKDVVTQAGKNALYIVNNREYTSSELEGKFIEIIGGFIFLNPENSSKYGDKGKDGVIMISQGKITNDIEKEMEHIDLENAPVKKSYIQIRKGEKPRFMEVNKTSGSTYKKSNSNPKTGSTSNSGVQGLEDIKGNPVFVLNGVKVERSKLRSIPQSSIEHITVLKGKDATSLYGKAAKDGAILISTKSDKIVVGTGMTFSTDEEDGNLDLYREMLSSPENPLMVINGIVQDENFDLQDQDPGQIKEMSVSRGEKVQTKFGKRAKDGVISIITKDAIGKKAYTIRNSSNQSRKPVTHTINSDSVNINASQWGTRSSPLKTIVTTGNTEPLFVIDGKVKPKGFDINSINHEEIASITVLKDKTSIKKYGQKAADGVIEITTKSAENQMNESPASFAVLKANTTDEGLKIMESQLKKQANLDVTFSNLKRNRDGLITAVKVKVTGKEGNQEVSATYNNTGNIPDIYIGIQNGTLMITSSPPRL